MDSTNLTKLEAHLIAGNGYNVLFNSEVCYIMEVHEDGFLLGINGASQYYSKFDQFGTDYFVLCHPLSRLTTEIEGIGVPLTKLWEMYGGGWPEWHRKSWEKSMYDEITLSPLGSLTVQMYQYILDWKFDKNNFIERGIGKEITLK